MNSFPLFRLGIRKPEGKPKGKTHFLRHYRPNFNQNSKKKDSIYVVLLTVQSTSEREGMAYVPYEGEDVYTVSPYEDMYGLQYHASSYESEDVYGLPYHASPYESEEVYRWPYHVSPYDSEEEDLGPRYCSPYHPPYHVPSYESESEEEDPVGHASPYESEEDDPLDLWSHYVPPYEIVEEDPLGLSLYYVPPSQSEEEEFQTGDILRFRSVPLHYAVYIGNGEIVHYNKLHGKICIIREKLKDYKKR